LLVEVGYRIDAAPLGEQGARRPCVGRGLTTSYTGICDRLEAARTAGDVQVENTTIDDILISLTGGK